MVMHILHVAAEALPLIKTGGLADVMGSLPAAQRALGHKVSLLMPGYPSVIDSVKSTRALPPMQTSLGEVQLLSARLAGDVELLIIDRPEFFDRPGNPYLDSQGRDWPDNLQRFALLGRVAASLCAQSSGIDVLHAHDWHAGLAPAYLEADGTNCVSCFTIHNLAYQGQFDYASYADTGLPEEFYRYDGLEYHGDWSFMKAGLSFCDAITTVSPTYSREILQAEAGMGLDGLLRHRRADLYGILNGVDYEIWDPAIDKELEFNYSSASFTGKAANKSGLQQSLKLEQAADRLLVGVVSRLNSHKGLDLAISAAEALLASNRMQLVVLGSGDHELESAYTELAQRYPDNCAVTIGYDEKQSHRIFGGADAILVPSRFEPCGLTQLYGLRYGTLPIVRSTGGLADTVVGYRSGNRDKATGFVFNSATVLALQRLLGRAETVYRDPAIWKALMRNAMRCEFGWDKAASAYVDLYRRLTTR